MVKKYRWKFAIGTKVRVKGAPGTARIVDRAPYIADGAVFLDPALDYMHWWNEDGLIRVSARSRK